MILVSWAVLLAAGVLCGAAVVAVMAAPRRLHLPSALLTAASATIAVVGVIGVSIYSRRADETFVAIVLGAAAFLGGFALGGTFLPTLGAQPTPASLPDPMPDATDGIGLVLLACAEQELYDPAAVARSLALLQNAGVPLPPEPTRVFIYASEKARYRAAGMSPARPTCGAIAERVSSLLAEDGFLPARLAWCDAEPQLDRAIADLAAEGVRTIVVVQLTVAEDASSTRSKRRVDAMRPEAHGLRVAYAEPLWGSSAIAERVAEHVAQDLGEVAPSSAGVALLGQGQPAEVESVHPGPTEHETLFSQRVRAALVERGFDGARVRLGWVEWQDPGVTETVRHLAALGCAKIAVVPSAMLFDTLTTILDVGDAIAHARVEDTSEVELLTALGDDPVVAQVLAANARAAAAEL
jgi:protoheme ferro-lyase